MADLNPAPAHARTVAYVPSAGSGELRVLALDAQTGALTELQCLALGGALMPMALNPQRTRLYVARRSAPLAVLSLSIGSDGRLALLGEAPLPVSMAYITTDRSGRFLLSASYHEHRVAVSAIDDEGVARDVLQVIPTEPNAHAIQADPSNCHVFATCLGGELLRHFDFDARSGRLSDHADARSVMAHAPDRRAGPRHLVFHPNGRWLYVLNELDASVAVFDLDGASGATRPVQRIDSLPPGFSGVPWAAEIRLSPDARHLYTSERRSSTVAAFDIDAADGRLALIGHQPTELQPRGFAIEPGGRWLLAVGQLSHQVCSHAIDPRTGALGPAGARLAVGTDSTWVETLALA
jgi:6-phosphogluconolactonase